MKNILILNLIFMDVSLLPRVLPSGMASFKCEGALNTTKSLSQTITPANRQCYTFSAQIASENLSKGTNGQVGIEVTFEYEDGTSETRFIDLI